jgi:sec-independent protein translocase protein TatA
MPDDGHAIGKKFMTLATSIPTDAFPNLLLAFGLPSGWEWILILAIGLLVFGRRLPEVGRSVGRSIVEFKKGIKGIESDIEEETTSSSSRRAAEISDDSTEAARSSMYEKASEGTPKDS